MDRQAVIEATIDYVLTNLKNGRSVGPSRIDQQERELQNAPRYMKMPKLIEDVVGAKSFDLKKRHAISKPNPKRFKPKWNANPVKFDQNKRQAMKVLKARSTTEEANPRITRTERIGPRLWKTKKPKAKVLKFKPKSKSVRSRAELIDKLTKTRVATKGKVKAVAKELPSAVAAKKGKLGTYLAKHNVHRGMVKRARGKSQLPEEMSPHAQLAKKAAEKVLPWSMTRWAGGTKRNKELAVKYPNVVKAGEASARIRASKQSVLAHKKKVGRDAFRDFAAAANMSRRELKHMYKRSTRKGMLHVPRDMKQETKMTRDELIEMLLEAERVTLSRIQRARYQRYDAQAGENAADVKRIAAGLDMNKPKMRKYATALYKDYVLPYRKRRGKKVSN